MLCGRLRVHHELEEKMEGNLIKLKPSSCAMEDPSMCTGNGLVSDLRSTQGLP
jgi:hypothetical protein